MTESYKSTEKLDSVFDKAVVLMSILAAAELAYLMALPSESGSFLSQVKIFSLIMTTFPFLVVIPLFMIKQLFIKEKFSRFSFFLTLLSWDFWGWSIWFCLYLFIGILGAVLGFSNYIVIGFGFVSWLIFLLFPLKIYDAYFDSYDLHFFPKAETYLRKRYVYIMFSALAFSLAIYFTIFIIAFGAFVPYQLPTIPIIKINPPTRIIG